MNRTLAGIVLGAVVVLAPACGGSDAPAASSPPTSAVDLDLPRSNGVVDVPVTKPAHPQPVKVEELPVTARAVNSMPDLSADEKVCANYAIKTTIDHDPSIATTNAKMASVLGNAVMACAPAAKIATVLTNALGNDDSPMSAEQHTCLEHAFASDAPGTASFLAAVLTLDIPTIASAGKHFGETCHVTLGPPTSG